MNGLGHRELARLHVALGLARVRRDEDVARQRADGGEAAAEGIGFFRVRCVAIARPGDRLRLAAKTVFRHRPPSQDRHAQLMLPGVCPAVMWAVTMVSPRRIGVPFRAIIGLSRPEALQTPNFCIHAVRSMRTSDESVATW